MRPDLARSTPRAAKLTAFTLLRYCRNWMRQLRAGRWAESSHENRRPPHLAPAFTIGQDVGVKHGVKVVIEEEQDIV